MIAASFRVFSLDSRLQNAGVSPLHPTKTFLERKVLDSKEL